MNVLAGNSPLPTLAPGNRLLVEGFRTLFYMELQEAPSVFPKIFEIRESNKRSETDFEFVGLTMAQQAVIGGQTEFESILDGGTKETKNLLFKKGFQVAEEDREDDLYGVLGKTGKMLPKTFTRRAEASAASVWAGMFSTTVGFDGLPICSTAHPFVPGRSNVTTGAATWSNRLAVDSALSPETLSSLQILLRQTRTREGMPGGLNANTLVVPVELEVRAWEILQSMYKAYTDTNERNIHGSDGKWPLKVISWEWIPSSTMYAVLDSQMTPFFFQWRLRPEFRQQTAMNNGIEEFYGRMRYGVDANEPRGIAGTPGA
jgi:phage major head subunit gpT-like protein